MVRTVVNPAAAFFDRESFTPTDTMTWLRLGLPVPLRGSEITPARIEAPRLQWLELMAGGAAGAMLAVWAGREAMARVARPGRAAALAALAALSVNSSTVPGTVTMEMSTPHAEVTAFNNHHEFGTDKADPALNAGSLTPRPWAVSIEGGSPQAEDLRLG